MNAIWLSLPSCFFLICAADYIVTHAVVVILRKQHFHNQITHNSVSPKVCLYRIGNNLGNLLVLCKMEKPL